MERVFIPLFIGVSPRDPEDIRPSPLQLKIWGTFTVFPQKAIGMKPVAFFSPCVLHN
jgi:hypothetical protein